MIDDEQQPHEFASPPCFMHELVAEYQPDLKSWSEVAGFRKSERERLIKERFRLTPDDRLVKSRRIARKLGDVIGQLQSQLIGVYWPFRGEPDLRDWMTDVVQSRSEHCTSCRCETELAFGVSQMDSRRCS